MKRLLTSIFAGVIVFGLVAAFAATLTVNSGSVAAGAKIAVTGCDDAVKVDYNVAWSGSAFVIDSVDVSDIADACDGSTLDVVLTDGTNDDTAFVTVPVAAGSTAANVPLTGAITAEDLTDVHVALSGV